MLALGFMLAAPAQAGGVPRLDEAEALRLSRQVVGTVPGDFTLLDRRERPVRLSELRGKPLLLQFMYTGCFTVCPLQTRRLREAVAGLDRMLGTDAYNVVSIGFNQPFDSPQAMRAFAAQHRIDYPHWKFLSPHHEQVEALARAYGFAYVETPAGFEHVVGVTVLDAAGRIHGHVYGDTVTAASLGVALRALVLGGPPAADARSSLEVLVERVRILCTVYDPQTGEYRFDWKLLLEVVGGLLFFLSAAVYLGREWRQQRRRRLTGDERMRRERAGVASQPAP